MNQARVSPIKIVSPISGTISIPKITEKVVGDQTIVEATWYDNASGEFIRRGLVKIIDNKTGKEVY